MEAFREQPVTNDKKVYPQNRRLCSFDSINYFSGIQKKSPFDFPSGENWIVHDTLFYLVYLHIKTRRQSMLKTIATTSLTLRHACLNKLGGHSFRRKFHSCFKVQGLHKY